MPKPRESLVGRRFGRLLVIEPAGATPHGDSIWLCLCDCGTRKLIARNPMMTNRTKSCGCLFYDAHKARRLPPGDGGLGRLFSQYKTSAKRTNRAFDIPFASFRLLTSAPCHYCGSPPCLESRNAGTSGNSVHSKYLFNGLDRVNNTRGYHVDNVVTCCNICNGAKSNMPQSVFISWLDRVCTFRIPLKS